MFNVDYTLVPGDDAPDGKEFTHKINKSLLKTSASKGKPLGNLIKSSDYFSLEKNINEFFDDLEL